MRFEDQLVLPSTNTELYAEIKQHFTSAFVQLSSESVATAEQIPRAFKRRAMNKCKFNDVYICKLVKQRQVKAAARKLIA
jgi:hypothetical protein